MAQLAVHENQHDGMRWGGAEAGRDKSGTSKEATLVLVVVEEVCVHRVGREEK